MNDNIVLTPVVGEVEQSFLDYSLSVITDRAIPAVEDGLKPVMRRILWEMQEDGLASNKQYVKCATPVGNTMAKYHPHGDSSIYGALVHASQPWTMRYPLIDFHGNNGSRDGDGPAAHRYTECRLSQIAESTLEHIKKNTVDWIPNYSETGEEPVYLPGRFPNLLCNGTTGIAVAMACSFAPHNLNEVMEAAQKVLTGDYTEDELLECIKGPDFPTGGIIVNQKELRDAYRTGKGRVRIRGEYHVESKSGRDTLVFDSIPYKISKENLILEIDTLCEEKKIEGIMEIRDESNKKGVRFVIELAKGINGDVIANKLYRLTELETTYSINQVALVDKTPRLLSFKTLVEKYVEHQEDVFLRRLNYELEKLKDRIHILHGLAKAVEDIDNVIQLIKSAENSADAGVKLRAKYGFTEVQAKAILDMKLSKLAHTEKIAIENELEEKQKKADALIILIENRAARCVALSSEFTEFAKKFGDARRTTVTNIEMTAEEKEVAEIVPENCVVVITEAGNIKRIPATSYRTQKRNGKGIKNQDEVIQNVIKTNTIDNLMVFSSFGKVYRLAVNDVPVGTNATRGTSIETLVAMDVGEKFVTLASVDRTAPNGQYVWFITKNGVIKKTGLSEYAGMKRKTGVIATTLREGDSLVKVFVAPDSQLIVFTKNGMGLRFDGKNVSASSRTSIGVKAINMNEGDSVADVVYLSGEKDIMIFAQNGVAKRVPLSEFVLQNRAGKGLICHKPGDVVAACPVNDDHMMLVVGDVTSICISASDVTEGSRATQGVMVIKGSNILGVARIN